MNPPVVAIVGRPNVGKSSLFNRIVRRRIAVVDDLPGVTRDRLYAPVEWNGRAFRVVDTGGLDLNPEDPLIDQVRAQAQVAILEAAVILFVVDVQEGITSQDAEVAELLRSAGKPIFLVAHKADHSGMDIQATEFFTLGIGEPLPVSSIHRRGVDDLLDAIVEHLPPSLPSPIEEEGEARRIRVAVVGRPNAGKSSLVNALLGEERLIVDDRPGTTRDAVNVQFEWEGRTFEFVDTAGMRRRSKIDDDIEKHSVLRATQSVEQSDVTWLILDVKREISHQDKTIANFVTRHGKLCILTANKSDLIEKDADAFRRYVAWIRKEFDAFEYLPVVFTSAKTGKHAKKLLETSLDLYNAAKTRIPTPNLNDFLRSVVVRQPPPTVKGRPCRLKYVTQVAVLPPTFVIFTNTPNDIPPSYERYLARQMREKLGFEGVPLRFVYRSSQSDKESR